MNVELYVFTVPQCYITLTSIISFTFIALPNSNTKLYALLEHNQSI